MALAIDLWPWLIVVSHWYILFNARRPTIVKIEHNICDTVIITLLIKLLILHFTVLLHYVNNIEIDLSIKSQLSILKAPSEYCSYGNEIDHN